MLKAAPLRLWALLCAGVVFNVASALLTLIVWLGQWPEILAPKRLDYIGMTLLACMGLNVVIVAALAAVKVEGTGPGGIGFSVAPGNDDTPPVQTEISQ